MSISYILAYDTVTFLHFNPNCLWWVPYEDLAEIKVDYWRTIEVKNVKKLLILKHLICVFILFIEIQPLYCFRGKMCKKTGKVRPTDGLISL